MFQKSRNDSREKDIKNIERYGKKEGKKRIPPPKLVYGRSEPQVGPGFPCPGRTSPSSPRGWRSYGAPKPPAPEHAPHRVVLVSASGSGIPVLPSRSAPKCGSSWQTICQERLEGRLTTGSHWIGRNTTHAVQLPSVARGKHPLEEEAALVFDRQFFHGKACCSSCTALAQRWSESARCSRSWRFS